MNATLDACLRSWPWDPWLLGALTLTALVYVRGWRILHRRDERRWPPGRLAAFLGGLGLIFLALASPIEPFSYYFLQVHMVQHLLLMMAAPPLLWLAAPLFPLLRGLPRPVRTVWIAPLLRSPAVRSVGRRLTHPLPALVTFVAVTWFWHLPPCYDLAMRSGGWHIVQHLCFLGSALLFWYPVVRPYPSRPTWPAWLLVPFLLLADVQNTVLSALLAFSPRILYRHYAEVPRLGGMSALEDQAAAGAIMWVPGSTAFLVPLFWIALRLLYPSRPAARRPVSTPRRIALPLLPTSSIAWRAEPRKGSECANSDRLRGSARRSECDNSDRLRGSARPDLLEIPLVGRFLHWRHARLCLQIPLLLLAGLIAVDGFTGPDVAAMNLAGVVPWIHWRGLVVLGLLALGNVFCMACPFTLPRTFARRWLPRGLAWPRRLRNKWLALGMLIAFLWAYEAFALWDSPWLTAWIILAYFAAAFAVDSVFRDGSFCKYVCPIGQFNFVQALMSPFEIKVRNPAVCDSCETKDCIRGNAATAGCALRLYQPRKSSNMDCTFCLDCVHACPHDNIGVLAGFPGETLTHDRHRSGVGRFGRRLDLAALIVVLVFGAFVHAALMTGPVVGWQERLMEFCEPAAKARDYSTVVMTVLLLTGLVVVPLLLLAAAAALSRRWGRTNENAAANAVRFVYALVPLGFGMWLTHYCFHFFTSCAGVLPVTQRFVSDWSGGYPGSPEWTYACCVPAAAWLVRLELLFLDVGLLASLYLGYRLAGSQTTTLPRSLAVLTPWAFLMLLLFAAGVWIVFQPMQMRGTM